MLSLPVELTHGQAKACLAALVAGLDAEAASPVVVNATALGRFDSSALAVLLELRRACIRGGKALVVQGLPSHLSDLATLYGIEGLLPSA
ncbi:MAG: STAS domain-containing protein [Pseudomonadota bacterium]